MVPHPLSPHPRPGLRTHRGRLAGALGAWVLLAGAACTLGTSDARPAVGSVVVVPTSATVAPDGSLQLTAIAKNDTGGIVTDRYVAWTSQDPERATVTTAGSVLGREKGGPVSVIATVDGVSGSAEVTVTPERPAPEYVYPLRVGPEGRHLVDDRGRPFLLVGDAGWSLISQLSREEAEQYLAARQRLGFNLVLVNLLEHKFSAYAPADIYGTPPFTGAPFTTPNEAYFQRADAIIRSAADKGMVVLLAPLYLGYECGPQGWCAQVEESPDSAFVAWGRYVGNRYRDFDNIVWLVGGDTDPTPVHRKMELFARALHDADPRHLVTAHNAPGQMAVDPWPDAPWLTLNNVYTPTKNVAAMALGAYGIAPPLPFFLIESDYENTQQTVAHTLRRQSYTTLLSGGFGHVFGGCPMWGFDAPTMPGDCRSSGWRRELFSQGSLNMLYFRKLFLSRHWDLLVPDREHRAVTDGYGEMGAWSYAPAAYASDGSTIIAYLPVRRALTVDPSVLAGADMTVWWYDPASGTSVSGGTFPNDGPRTLTPPDAGDDWVLVVDGQGFGFGAPGT